jgi:hypothetical protein
MRMRASAGELFFIGYQIDAKPPACWYAGLDAEGALAFDVRVDLADGVMMHDMAVTQDYGIIVDTPLVFRPEVCCLIRLRTGAFACLLACCNWRADTVGLAAGCFCWLASYSVSACRGQRACMQVVGPCGGKRRRHEQCMCACVLLHARAACMHANGKRACGGSQKTAQALHAGMCAQVMVTQDRLPLVFDKSRPARFGLLPKRPKSAKEIRWFEAPPGVGGSCISTLAQQACPTLQCPVCSGLPSEHIGKASPCLQSLVSEDAGLRVVDGGGLQWSSSMWPTPGRRAPAPSSSLPAASRRWGLLPHSLATQCVRA